MSDQVGASAESEPAVGLRHLVDHLIFAPIGALTAMRGDVEGSALRGRQRVEQQFRNARFIGEMVVQQGSKEIIRRLRDVSPSASSSAAAPPTPDTEPAASRAVTTEPDAGKTIASIDHLVAGYNDLSALQVIRLLDSFSSADLQELVVYESATRSRRTILNKAAQLLAEGE